MRGRSRSRFTILKAMATIAFVGCLLGGLAANRHQLDVLGVLVFPFLVVAIPAHFAIEANRRDDALAGDEGPQEQQ